jgi:hypothetical protein
LITIASAHNTVSGQCDQLTWCKNLDQERIVKTLVEVLGVLWQAIKSYWDEFFFLAIMNVVTMIPVLLSLILLYVFAVLWVGGSQTWALVLMALQIVPAILFPPALAGLWNAANRVADDYAAYWSDYFAGFRLYFWKSLVLAALNILVVAAATVSIRFYAPGTTPLDIDPSLSTVLMMVGIFFGSMWLIYQMYPMAMLIEQSDKRLWVALRNAAVLYLRRPAFAVLLALLLLIIIAISALLQLPLIIVTGSLVAVICNKAVKHLLVPDRERLRAREEETETEQEQDRSSQ